ncbi:MAG TPA: preprotein translocase subunit SecE [Pseudobdellovibrionaceae bacterium]|nr:preprotein translocase subunit SecE [Pseudobdellovibrionaceae bacterium]
MDKNNAKVITISFVVAGALVAFVINLLIVTFSGAFSVVAKLADSDFVRHILPVLIGFVLFLALQFNKKVLIWADEVVSEIRKVVWPSQKDTTAMAIVVVIMVLIAGGIISLFDFVSGVVVNSIIK